MARIHYIRYPDLAVICLPVALLGNPLLLAAAVGRGIVAAGTLRIAGILLGLGGIALVVRLRGIGRLVILLLGVIGLLVLVVGFFFSSVLVPVEIGVPSGLFTVPAFWS